MKKNISRKPRTQKKDKKKSYKIEKGDKIRIKLILNDQKNDIISIRESEEFKRLSVYVALEKFVVNEELREILSKNFINICQGHLNVKPSLPLLELVDPSINLAISRSLEKLYFANFPFYKVTSLKKKTRESVLTIDLKKLKFGLLESCLFDFEEVTCNLTEFPYTTNVQICRFTTTDLELIKKFIGSYNKIDLKRILNRRILHPSEVTNQYIELGEGEINADIVNDIKKKHNWSNIATNVSTSEMIQDHLQVQM